MSLKNLKCPEEGLFLSSWRAITLLCAVTLLTYFRTVFFDFTYLDDDFLILHNWAFLRDPLNAFNAFKTEVFYGAAGTANYRPVLMLSFMADAMLGKNSVALCHLTNVFLHMSAVALVFTVLNAVLKRRLFSFLAALLFAVHPVLNQAVAWLPGRNDTLLAVFVLSAFLFLIKFAGEGKTSDFCLHLLFFAVSLFTKENAVFSALIFAYYTGLINAGALTPQKRRLLFGGWTAMLVIWFLLRKSALGFAAGGPAYHPLSSLLHNSPAVIPYLIKAVFPFHLSVYPVMEDLAVFPGIIVLAALSCLFLFYLKAGELKITGLGILWFFIFLLPAFIQPSAGTPNFSEHRIYLPMAGLLLAAGGFNPPERRHSAKFTGSVVLIAAFFLMLSFNRLGVFRDRFSFWSNAVRTSPTSYVATSELAAAYYDGGAYAAAERLWLETVALNPKDYEMYFNLGILCLNSGRFPEAENFWKKALDINPDHTGALNNLAVLNYNRKAYKKAAVYVSRLLKHGVAADSRLLKATAPYR